jgi:hypothetical protein
VLLAVPIFSVIPQIHRTASSDWGWDPSFMWEQIPQTVRIATLVLFPSALVFVINGFRNASAPWWLAAAGLIALPIVVQHEMWRIVACYGQQARVWYFVEVGAVAMMFLHHIVQRPSSLQPQTIRHDGDAR